MKRSILTTILYTLAAGIFATSVNGQNLSPTNLKLEVKAKLMSNNVDSARIFSNRLLKQAPTAENYLLAGSVSEIAHDHTNADKLYQQAISLATDSERYKIVSALGYVSLNRGDTSSAIRYQNQSLALNSGQAEPHHLLSILYRMKNNPDSATYHALKAYQLDSAKIDYIRFMVNMAYEKGDLLSAIMYLKRLNGVRKTSMDADSNKTKDALANFYLKIDDYEHASPLLRQLTEDSVKKDIYYYNLAKCYDNLNEEENAVQSVSKAIAVSPEVHQEYYDLLINIYQAMGQQSRVIETYVAGKNKGIPSYAGWLASYQVAVTQAKMIFSRLSQESKEQQKNDMLSLARLYLFAKDNNNSLKALNSYTQLNGAAADSIYLVYSSAYAGLNLLPAAKTSILSAIKISPDNINYKFLLLSILYRQKDYGGVIELIQKNDQHDVLIDADLKDNMLFKCYTILGDSGNAVKFKPVSN